ncbi:MAG: DUF2268 domain-containing putative Zn-dependent protease [Acidimicrobiales bacterium]
MSLTHYVARASGRLDTYTTLIDDVFQSVAATCRELLDANAIDVLFIDAPDDVIAEWGVGGYTWGPHVILVALDPAFAISRTSIESTLLHEFHHAMRWRTAGCGGNLAQMLVSEGLAQLFEEEVLREAPFFATQTVTTSDVELARAALFAQPFSQAKWFFGADNVARHFAYAYGYQLCRAYASASGQRSSQLVNVETREVLRAAGLL